MDKVIINETQHSDMKNHISDMLGKLIDTSSKTDKQEEKLTKLSSKLSTYEEHIDKVIINKMQQPFPLQFNNEQDERITYLSSKISTYEDRLDKLSIT